MWAAAKKIMIHFLLICMVLLTVTLKFILYKSTCCFLSQSHGNNSIYACRQDQGNLLKFKLWIIMVKKVEGESHFTSNSGVFLSKYPVKDIFSDFSDECVFLSSIKREFLLNTRHKHLLCFWTFSVYCWKALYRFIQTTINCSVIKLKCTNANKLPHTDVLLKLS